MLETEAVIVEIKNSVAYVETQRLSGCGHCDPQKGCATSTLTKFFGGKKTFFKALNPIEARVGDAVVIGVEDGAVLKGSFAVYLLPILFVLLGAGVGNALASTAPLRDLLAIIGAVTGLGVSYVWVRAYTAYVSKNSHFQPVILRKISTDKIVNFIKEI